MNTKKNQFVPKSYHITEVKNVHIESVDCGGRPDTYFQTIIQLWVNPEEFSAQYLSTNKALKIMDTVDQVKPIRLNTEIFFEWGHGGLATSNYTVKSISNEENRVIVQLSVPATVCKPKLEMKGCC